MVIIVIIGHFIWMTLLYHVMLVSIQGQSWTLIRWGRNYISGSRFTHHAGALPVAYAHPRVLACQEVTAAPGMTWWTSGIPLFANIHLCGSVLTGSILCHDGEQDTLRFHSYHGDHGLILHSRHICHWGAWRARRYGNGVPGADGQASLDLRSQARR